MKKILIVGCGYVGRALARKLKKEGWGVTGVVATETSAIELRQSEGVEVKVADCCTAEGARKIGSEYFDLVLYAVSSGGRDYRYTYFEGMRHLLEALKKNPPKQMMYLGSASVYAQIHGEWVSEVSPTEPQHPNGKILRETEILLLETARRQFPATVLRLTGIYGPGRHHWLDELRKKEMRLSLNPNTLSNRIFREDIVQAIMTVWEQGILGRFEDIVNVTDDHPTSHREIIEWLCSRLGRSVPSFNETMVSRRSSVSAGANRRVSNALLKKLGWIPMYPSFREGFAFLDAES